MSTKEKYSAIPKEERKRLGRKICFSPPLLWWLLVTVLIPVFLSRPIGNRLLPPTASAVFRFCAELLFAVFAAAAISYVLFWPKLRAAVVKAYEKA